MPCEKGARITTSPIPQNAVKRIERLLEDKPRDLMLFTLGVQSGLRIGTILKLTVAQVKYLQIGDSIQTKESKTGKTNNLVINSKSYKAIQGYIDASNPIDSEPLFKSRKGNEALTVSTVSHMVKGWCRMVGLKDRDGNFASHSLRKTWAYSLRTKGVAIELLSLRLNHSSLKITERYLGITPQEEKEILMIDV